MDVLIADDDPVSLHLLKAQLLKWQYKVIACPDGAESWKVLQSENPPRLAIFDWTMPGFTGPQLCEKIRARTNSPYVYVLLLTSRGETSDLVVGLQAGADDYLTKPFDVRELEVRLRTGTRILQLQSELMAAQERLRLQATHDNLTGVLNRAAVLEQLERELVRANRESAPLSVILVDLDFFKTINDTLGHLAGDAVLIEAVQRMKQCTRPYDVLGRLGGEEFLLVLPGSDATNALRQAERIREAVAAARCHYGQQDISVTCSQGVTTWTGNSVPEVSSLIAAADGAMYLAKCGGRNRVEYLELERRVMKQPLSRT